MFGAADWHEEEQRRLRAYVEIQEEELKKLNDKCNALTFEAQSLREAQTVGVTGHTGVDIATIEALYKAKRELNEQNLKLTARITELEQRRSEELFNTDRNRVREEVETH